MRRCFVGETHDMLSAFDDVFRPLGPGPVADFVERSPHLEAARKEAASCAWSKVLSSFEVLVDRKQPWRLFWLARSRQPCDLTGSCPPQALVNSPAGNEI